MRHRFGGASLLALIGAACASGTGHAQSQPDASAHAASEGQLEEVIVTAQKRSENLQTTPVAVQAVAGDELARNGVRDIGNLNRLVPTLQVQTVAGSTVLAIRGIRTNDASAGAESPNAVHINGAYISRQTGLNGLLFDVDHIELLKGPQGTLYGRNATAGALNIITRRPTQTYSANVEVEGGTYDLLRAEGGANLPVSDTLAFRAAFRALSRDGYFKNRLDDAKQQSGRLSALWSPNDRAELFVVGDYAHVGGKGGSDNLVLAAPGSVVPPARDDSQLYGKADRAGLDTRVWGLMGQFAYKFDPVTLTIVASNRGLKASGQAYAGGNLTYLPASNHSSSLEARISSAETKPLNYVAGVYYFEESGSGALYNFASQTSQAFSSYFLNSVNDTKSYAAFSQATWSPFEPLHLTAGIRYTEDHKRGAGATLLLGNLTPFAGQDVWSAVNYKLGVSYDLAPRSMLYANVSTGFKAGGFAFGANPKYDPEHIVAYEAGSKNRFFDNRLQLNADAFLYHYRNFEITYTTAKFDPATRQVLIALNAANAGRAQIYGLDLEGQWLVTDTDRLDATVSYLHAFYQENDLRRYGQLDLSGQPLPNSPRWSFTAAYTHTWQLGSGILEARADTLYSGRRLMNLTRTDAPDARFQKGYFRTNLSLRYAPTGRRWSVTGYVNDIENSTAWNSVTVSATNTFATFTPPRTAGAILSASF